MKRFVATFYTHLSALMTCRALENAGFTARMAPVPRVLSSSCGTCVFYTAPDHCANLLDEDTEAVYAENEGTYETIIKFS